MAGINSILSSDNSKKYLSLKSNGDGWFNYYDLSYFNGYSPMGSTPYQIALSGSAGNTVVVGLVEHGFINLPYVSFIVKHDSNGSVLWYRILSTPASQASEQITITDVACDTAENIYITGLISVSDNLPTKNFIMKLTSDGATSWYSTFYKDNTIANNSVYVQPPSIAITPNSASPTITVAATVVNSSGGLDFVLLRYPNAGGTPTFSRSITKAGVTTDIGKTADQVVMDTSGNIYALTCYTNNSAVPVAAVVKYNNTGTFQWSTDYNMSTNGTSLFFDGSTTVSVLDSSGSITTYNTSGAATSYITGFFDGTFNTQSHTRGMYHSQTSTNLILRSANSIGTTQRKGISLYGANIPNNTYISDFDSAAGVVADSSYYYLATAGMVCKLPLNGKGYNEDLHFTYGEAGIGAYKHNVQYLYQKEFTAPRTTALSGTANNPLTQSTGTITISSTLSAPTNVLATVPVTGQFYKLY